MPCGLGDAADDTEEESYDVVEGIGDLGYVLWPDPAI